MSGDWSTATSITGDASGATANIAGFVSPSYGIGDKVIWGGYSWTNVNGNIGASVDVLNLNAEWTRMCTILLNTTSLMMLLSMTTRMT